jgi:hypothetical protein
MELGRAAARLLPMAVFVVVAGFAPVQPVTPPAGAAPGPYSSWDLRLDPDASLAPQTPRHVDTGITVEGTLKTLEVKAGNGTLQLDAPGDSELQAGQRYDGAVRYPFNNEGQPGFSLLGCNQEHGWFTVHEISADVLGNVDSLVVTLEHHCEYAVGGTYGAIAWHASHPAPPPPPVFAVRVDHHRLDYRQPLSLDISLSPDSSERSVSVYTQKVGGQQELLTTTTVDGSGQLSVPMRPEERMAVSVVFHGGAAFGERSRTISLDVAGRVRSRLRGTNRKQGRVHLYTTAQDAVLVALVEPAHPHKCLQFRLQARVRGTWGYDSVVKCVHLDKHSLAAIRLSGEAGLRVIPIRMRGEWRGDARSRQKLGSWQYLRFT